MIIIGEKINGAIPSVKKAIEEKDADYIANLAKVQTEAGADYLDCCASVEEGEIEALKWLIDVIQDAVDTPICVDSPDPDALVAGVEFCNKPGIINSISVTGGKMEKIFPVMQENPEWKVIAMMDNENGIPQSIEERVEVGKRIVETAAEYDITPNRIIIDALVETVATNQETMNYFTGTIRELKSLYPELHFTSGLSNVSFGLPGRKAVNMPFMALSIAAGMDSAIVDPLNRDMMGVIYGTSALVGNDDFCMNYISAYREGVFGPPLEEREED